MSDTTAVSIVPMIDRDGMNLFIVAEISKNWIEGQALTEWTLAQQFEAVIEVNRQRGYVLHSFQLHRLMTQPNQMNETIIAVFQRVQP